MGRTAFTQPQCLNKGDIYLYNLTYQTPFREDLYTLIVTQILDEIWKVEPEILLAI